MVSRADAPVLLFLAVLFLISGVFTMLWPEKVRAGMDSAADALVYVAFFLGFGVFLILMPGRFRAALDNAADAWDRRGWRPAQMSLSILRLTVCTIGLLAAGSFAYMGYVALHR